VGPARRQRRQPVPDAARRGRRRPRRRRLRRDRRDLRRRERRRAEAAGLRGRGCGLHRADLLEDRFGARPVEELDPRYNITPTDDLPVIQNEAPHQIDQLYWGFVPHWVDDRDDWPEPINARAETVADKPAFRDAFRNRRCLVIADGFYEWEDADGKTPYRVCLEDNQPFAMAGLWETWEGENGEQLESVVIITTEPNAVVEPIHDRMPVVLELEDEQRWLGSADLGKVAAVLDPYEGGEMDAYAISTRVNNPANDSAEVILPADG